MKLCVALDQKDESSNLNLVKNLKGLDIWLKVGLRSYIRDGKDFLDKIRQIDVGFKIFLDLKIYDIPNTMADAAESMAELKIDMFNVHASAGKEAMKAVMKRLDAYKNPPLVLAVTALTSFDDESFRSIYNESLEKKALDFAKDSFESGINGVVCSAYESKNIKEKINTDFITLIPGIRPFGEDRGDQKRVANLQVAKENKSDFIVVGRPIYQSSNPRSMTQKILENI
ncbi:MAG: orotidine-5'-phosphate decarboxylase [Proteobacteria bacterium]|nr:MAG: orotidine-5'-phosphate decarboxylase [Pseudomonadota bacterium]